jgi:hypothetical protein
VREGLTQLVRILKIASSDQTKAEMLSALHKFYEKPNCISEIYCTLSSYEKDLFVYYYQNCLSQSTYELDQIAAKRQQLTTLTKVNLK